MPKDVLLYGSINSYSASDFIAAIDENKSQDITVRVNSDGGEVRYGWGMIAKFAELTGKKLVKNDGEANSMAAFYFCYADDAEAIDAATFGFHRAGYADWIESDPEYFTAEDRASLLALNKKLRAAFEAKVDVELFNALGKGTVEEMFSMDGRILIEITAQEAKKVGLINRITTITPTKKAEIEALRGEVTAKYSGLKVAAKTETKTNHMNIEKLKAEHPDVFAQIVALGVAQEKDRVEACMAFVEIDPVGVKAAIESGKPLTQKAMADFTVKALSKENLKKIAAEATPTVTTTEATAEKTEKEKSLEAFEAEAKKHLSVK